MAIWRDFAHNSPELAAIGAEQFPRHLMAWLATNRPGGFPRVHPVTALIADNGKLYVFMEPTSPKGHDLKRDGRYALHSHVPDILGDWYGALLVTGLAKLVENPEDRAAATRAVTDAQFPPPPDRYILFELGVSEAVGTPGGDEPRWSRWKPEPG